MIEVVLFSEGPTEVAFSYEVLVGELGNKDISLHPRLIRTSRRAHGGALAWDRVYPALREALRQRADTYVTTFFDLYGLTSGFPGFTQATRLAEPVGRTRALENELHTTVVQTTACRPDRFITPHSAVRVRIATIYRRECVRSGRAGMGPELVDPPAGASRSAHPRTCR